MTRYSLSGDFKDWEADWLEDPDLRPAQPEYNSAAVEKVQKLLETLTPLQRQVVELRAAGLRHREIGAIIWPDISEGHARQRSEIHWRVAKAKLRKEPTPHQINHRRRYRRKTADEWRDKIINSDPVIGLIRSALASSLPET